VEAAGHSQFHQAFIPASLLSFQPIFIAIDALDLDR
jgi:hypothetical protein